jgi:SAM-dependent methyltransferase
MSEAMSAEFDTVADWTARVAMDLGPSFRIPAGCRGSGSPAVLDWLLERLDLAPGVPLLDCGAGVGGPAAYAVEQHAIDPLLVEPERGACRAARALFGHRVIQASASALPLADETFDAAWCLGVLCTVPDQLGLLTELRRTVRRSGRIGLLIFMARAPVPPGQLAGNHFPTEDVFMRLVDEAGLQIQDWCGTDELASAPPEWECRVDAVTEELGRRHHGARAWELAERQATLIGRLLGDSTITGEALILRRRQ